VGAHVSAEELVAWLDGEVAPARAQTIALHVRDCPDCTSSVRAITHDAAAVTAALSSARATSSDDAYGAILRRHARRRLVRTSIAASILAVVLAGGAAALVTRFPIGAWLDGLTDRDASAPEQPAPGAQIDVAPHLSVRAPAAVEVTIAAPSDSLLIRVSLSAEPWLEVRTGPGEVLDRIEFDEQILTVEPGSARSIGITLPARSRLRILVGDDTILAREPAGVDGGVLWMDTTILLAPRPTRRSP
jgi:hypothetical protein